MNDLLQQLKKRRLDLGLKQNDMLMRVGISRQQYQRIESQGNPRLNTLELIAQGLKSELVLIPKEKLIAVQALLKNEDTEPSSQKLKESEPIPLSEDPWQGLLDDTQ